MRILRTFVVGLVLVPLVVACVSTKAHVSLTDQAAPCADVPDRVEIRTAHLDNLLLFRPTRVKWISATTDFEWQFIYKDSGSDDSSENLFGAIRPISCGQGETVSPSTKGSPASRITRDTPVEWEYKVEVRECGPNGPEEPPVCVVDPLIVIKR